MWQAADRPYSAVVGREQLEIFRDSMTAWNRGDVAAMVAHATPDAEYVIAEQNPGARVLHGREEIAAYLEDWRETVCELRYEVGELRQSGDVVVSTGTMTGRAGEGGPEISAELAFVLHFDGTQVFRTEEYLDARRALEAAGLA
jgi:ketosteroid isomerase-like protein